MSARRRATRALLLAATLATSGCATWSTTPLAPRAFIEQEEPWRVRVTRPDGDRVELDEPTVRNDSIVSVRRVGCRPDPIQPDRRICDTSEVVVPLVEVRDFRYRRTSVGRTVLLSLGVAIALVPITCMLTPCFSGYN